MRYLDADDLSMGAIDHDHRHEHVAVAGGRDCGSGSIEASFRQSLSDLVLGT